MSESTTASSAPASHDLTAADPAQRSQAMIAHLLGILSVVGTGAFYAMKKNDPTAGGFVQDQMKEAFNFQCAILVGYVGAMIAVGIIGMISGLLALLLYLGVAVVMLGVLVLIVLSALKASRGEAVRYPVKLPVLN